MMLAHHKTTLSPRTLTDHCRQLTHQEGAANDTGRTSECFGKVGKYGRETGSSRADVTRIFKEKG